MRSPLLLALALAFGTLPLMGQSNEVAVWAGGSHVGSTDVTGTTIHFNHGHSYGASFNHFWSDHLSGEVAAFVDHHDGRIEIAGADLFSTGSLRIMPVMATVQWHRSRAARLDYYAGGGVAYVRANSLHSSDLDSLGIGKVEVKSRVGWSGVGGVSYRFMPALAVAGEARYVGYHPDSGPSDARVRLKLSPLIYSLGLRWRF